MHCSKLLKAGFALVVVSLASPGVHASSFGIDQVDWLSSSGGYLAQNSEWGVANVQFGPGDESQFSQVGGVYEGYMQVLTNVAGGAGTNNWAVQNKLMMFNSPSEFEGRLPDSLDFNLGVPRGDDLSGNANVRATEFITPTPLSSEPQLNLSSSQYDISVGKEQWLFGGGANDQGSPIYSGEAGAVEPPTAENYVGTLAADIGNKPTDVKIKIPQNQIPAVNEEINGCGPAAGARSIKYLQSLNLTKTTKTAQQIYDDLKTNTYMKTKLGNVPNAGTSPTNFVNGKNKYSQDQGLKITTDTTLTAALAQMELDESKDVEAHIYWGKNDKGQDLGGHIAFVSEIIVTQDAQSKTTSYEIQLIDDPTQGDGKAENRTQWLKFDGDDNLVSGGVKGTGAKFQTFYVETGTAMAPEPGSAVLLLGAAGLALIRRHRVA